MIFKSLSFAAKIGILVVLGFLVISAFSIASTAFHLVEIGVVIVLFLYVVKAGRGVGRGVKGALSHKKH